MSDAAVVAAVAASGSTVTATPDTAEKKGKGKKVTAPKAKKPSVGSTHPPTQQMVDASIKNLKERGGSSLLAIKKYISATYKCDVQKLAPFIKKYIKSAVVSGKLIQTKGKGASGSFKLSPSATKDPKAKSIEKKTTKSSAVPKPKKAAIKKVTGEKKVKKTVTATAAKKAADKKRTEKAKVKSVKKAGTVKAKPAKAKLASKPKAPKPKTVAVKPKKTAAPKKPAAKKPTVKK